MGIKEWKHESIPLKKNSRDPEPLMKHGHARKEPSLETAELFMEWGPDSAEIKRNPSCHTKSIREGFAGIGESDCYVRFDYNSSENTKKPNMC